MQTLTSIWYHSPTLPVKDLLGTSHGRVLKKMTKGLKGKCIDLGCGNQQASILFDDYTGVDLPKFNVYADDLEFIEGYDIVLMNAFIDVMQWPLWVLAKVLKHCKKYVIIHRQEFTHVGPTTTTQEPAYGGWTYHSKINYADFHELIRGFKVKRYQLDFDNWEEGGYSFLLKKI